NSVLPPLAGLALLATACGGLEPEQSGTVGIGPEQQQNIHFIDGVPAPEFYKDLQYRKGDGDKPHYYLTGDWEFLETFTKGNLFFRATLVLQDQRKFGLIYEEALGYYEGEKFVSQQKLLKEVLHGSWELDGIEMRFGELATGSGNFQGNQKVITLRFLRLIGNE